MGHTGSVENSLASGNTVKAQREDRSLKNIKNKVTSLNVPTEVVCRKFKPQLAGKLVDVATLLSKNPRVRTLNLPLLGELTYL